MPKDDERGIPIGRIPTMTTADVTREIVALKQRVTDLEALNVRRGKDWDAERSTTLEAVTRHVGDIMRRELAPVAELGVRFERFEALQKVSVEMQMESALERGRRTEREEATARELKARALDIEEKKVTFGAKSDEVKMMVDGRVRTKIAIMGLIGVLATVASGLAVNTCNHMPPQSQKP